ncbi:hypothetical protein HDV00_002279 [Rhizophlyctis rosea]|nr:hypothetical protein HDV00_002279 [Rhizophlyctis rosea]
MQHGYRVRNAYDVRPAGKGHNPIADNDRIVNPPINLAEANPTRTPSTSTPPRSYFSPPDNVESDDNDGKEKVLEIVVNVDRTGPAKGTTNNQLSITRSKVRTLLPGLLQNNENVVRVTSDRLTSQERADIEDLLNDKEHILDRAIAHIFIKETRRLNEEEQDKMLLREEEGKVALQQKRKEILERRVGCLQTLVKGEEDIRRGSKEIRVLKRKHQAISNAVDED